MTDRIVDGLDQSALLLEGDTHSRHDHVFVFTGPTLRAIVKGNYRKHCISPDPTAGSWIAAASNFLLHDTCEKTPMLINLLHFKEAFYRRQTSRELWKSKYPDWPAASGPAFKGLTNARPQMKTRADPLVQFQNLPFD